VPISQLAVVSVAEVVREVDVDSKYEGKSEEAPRGYVRSMATGSTDWMVK
jgi:hypothetical protein